MAKFKNIILSLMLLFILSCGSKQPEQEVTLVLDWVPNTNHTGIFVADELGYFKDAGIKMNIVQPAEDSSATIVGSGKAQFGIYFQPNMVKRLLKDVPITAVAAILPHNTAGLMTLDSLPVNSPKDLKKYRYSSWEDKIDDATVKHIVKADKLNIVPSETTNAIAALKSNIFDYIIVYYGWDVINAKIKGVPTKFFAFKDYEPIFDYYSPVIITNNDFLKNNKELSKKVLKAIKKGYEYAAKNPDKAADILIKHAPEGDPNLIRESQKWLSTQYIDGNKPWGIFDINRWDNFYNWLYKEKLINKKLPPAAGVTNEYIQ